MKQAQAGGPRDVPDVALRVRARIETASGESSAKMKSVALRVRARIETQESDGFWLSIRVALRVRARIETLIEALKSRNV